VEVTAKDTVSVVAVVVVVEVTATEVATEVVVGVTSNRGVAVAVAVDTALILTRNHHLDNQPVVVAKTTAKVPRLMATATTMAMVKRHKADMPLTHMPQTNNRATVMLRAATVMDIKHTQTPLSLIPLPRSLAPSLSLSLSLFLSLSRSLSLSLSLSLARSLPRFPSTHQPIKLSTYQPTKQAKCQIELPTLRVNIGSN